VADLLLPIGIVTTLLPLVALSGGLGLALRRARSDARVARGALHAAEQDLDRAQATVEDLRGESRGLRGALQVAEEQHRNVQQRLSEALEASSSACQRLSRDVEATKGQLAHQAQELEARRREVAVAERHTRRHRRVLTSLGLDLAARRDPLDPAERVRSAALVRQTLMSSGAEAVGLVDGRGLAAFAAGRDAAVERLQVAGALAAQLEPDLGAVLCASVAGVSLSGPRFSDHLLRLHGTPWYVAAENLGDVPMAALRHARLELTGLPTPPGPVPELPEHVIDLDDVCDQKLVELLTHWCRRWNAQGATVLGADGRPLAATPTADPGAAMGLRLRLGPFLARAHRDRVPVDRLVVAGWSEDGITAQAILTHDDLDTAAVVVLATAALPDEALDEIRSTVRWHLSATTRHALEAS
jgi:hypothetical protein